MCTSQLMESIPAAHVGRIMQIVQLMMIMLYLCKFWTGFKRIRYRVCGAVAKRRSRMLQGVVQKKHMCLILGWSAAQSAQRSTPKIPPAEFMSAAFEQRLAPPILAPSNSSLSELGTGRAVAEIFPLQAAAKRLTCRYAQTQQLVRPKRNGDSAAVQGETRRGARTTYASAASSHWRRGSRMARAKPRAGADGTRDATWRRRCGRDRFRRARRMRCW